MEAVNANNFDEVVLKYDGLVVVDFNADWCGPCQMLKPMLEQMATENPSVKFVGVNVDQNGELARKYGVMSIPCVVVIKNGQEITRHVGLASKADLQDILQGIQA